MRKRQLQIDWKAVEGAAVKRRILHLRLDANNEYICPIPTCLISPYRSGRGVRKHINAHHSWYLWFDQKPRIQREEAITLPKKKLKPSTHKMAAFTLDTGFGREFLNWLMTPCGGGKVIKEATQIGRRAMKFLAFALGEPMDIVIQVDFVDCVVGSPTIIINFMQTIVEEWELASGGALNYLKAVSDLMDFRKASGVTDNVLRSFTTTEVYIRRGLGNLARQKKIDYARNLDLESLISRNSWASLHEMEMVIPHHTELFESIVNLIRNKETPTISDLAFATRFIITFLFLRVKSSRPMTYKFMTLQQVHAAKSNGGYIDQSTFKTASTYVFDTLILSEAVLTILDTYIKVVRPLLHPKCEYVILTTNGTQFQAFGTAMSLLVFQAINKVVHPTRYRQILESESAVKLTPSETEALSKDNKHSSQVAKRIYQKKLSRDVAHDGLSSLEKLVGSGRYDHNNAMAQALTISDNEPKEESDSALPPTSHSVPHDPTSPVIASTPRGVPETVQMIGESDLAVQATSHSISHDPPSPVEVSSEQDVPETVEISGEESSPSDIEEITASLANNEGELAKNPHPILVEVTEEEAIPASSSISITTTQSSTLQQLQLKDVTVPVLSLHTAIPPATISIFNNLDLDVKKEEAQRQVEDPPRLLRFTADEDMYLRRGTTKYGIGQWAKILKDQDFQFHIGRTRDSLRMRAETLRITKRKRKSTRKSKSSVNQDAVV